ncbi:MAG: transcriptional repressor [Actinomycetota bacterium]|nr:transcriptional repressor [Actinomycetota bacterium]
MPGDLDTIVAGRLERVGQRYTPVRKTVVEVLAAAARPLTLPEILDSAAGLAQSSAYRTLAVMEEAGVVRRIAGPTGFARYELAEDVTEHHHHLVCVSCGGVEDLAASTRVERTVARAVDEAAATMGFRSQGHRLDVVGLCARCH